ncbi:MAG: xanthine phosphoribosyltransferase [Oscillospiraceae bacterium]|nr:xanthine phosphoribosyltransferase [Oscillospiraceae bacterium]
MRLLEERIRREALVVSPDVLRVDMFLNHLIDAAFLDELGAEFARVFADEIGRITKILTVEASGIAIACAAARHFDVPVLFAKKGFGNKTLDKDVYCSSVFSFTKETVSTVSVARRFLCPGERVLVIDDFLANGAAARGLLNIIEQADAELAGVGIVIEKGFQPGGMELRAQGVRVESLAVIESMGDGRVTFADSEALAAPQAASI